MAVPLTLKRPPWWALARVAPAVVGVLLRLRRLQPRLAMDELVAAMAPSRPRRLDAYAAAFLARGLANRLRWLFPQPCLYASLAGYHFLRLAGQDAVIHVGVRTEGNRLFSHAWLTVDGVPCFGDPQQHGLVEMVSYPRPEPDSTRAGSA